MDEQLGFKILIVLRSNPTVHEFAKECGLNLTDAYKLQDLYTTFWQTMGKMKAVPLVEPAVTIDLDEEPMIVQSCSGWEVHRPGKPGETLQGWYADIDTAKKVIK